MIHVLAATHVPDPACASRARITPAAWFACAPPVLSRELPYGVFTEMYGGDEGPLLHCKTGHSFTLLSGWLFFLLSAVSAARRFSVGVLVVLGVRDVLTSIN